MAKRRVRWWSSVPNAVKGVAGVISALGVIIGALASFGGYIESLIVGEVSDRLDGLESGLSAVHQDTVRLQLINMIQHDPNNTETILNIAREYFIELKGDWYATAMFKSWADERGIDISAFGDLR